ncbi:hypothetical protein GCM10023175_03800 [Pseudonocardia xishanensis]|uniref:Helix-turn-helix domain-containing protein n=1 Tax=Pseudonocardia xishanensis TaxID=630995 RepID=A0ABP8RE09_9PSEU
MSNGSESATRPTFYDVQEVADMFKMSRMTVYRAISSGELAAVRIRGRWLVPARAIDALIETATRQQATTASAGQFGGLA